MRQQQNNKNRMRGRGRKPSNSTNRNYESNGPDVKIRGNAAHIAEKYTTLARDALSSGDRVIAENYLQHAEHYNRIVLANNAAREEAQAERARNQAAERESGEQPEVQATDSVEATGEEAQESENRRPRRRNASGQGRGRNGRGEDDSEAQKEALPEGDVSVSNGEEATKPRTRRTSRKKADVSENISSDAAGLPQGLLGGAVSRESAAAEE